MINVVAAIIINKEGKILITQRNFKKSQGGLWEFPGGKINMGETPEEALKRELLEEFNDEIKVGHQVSSTSIYHYDFGEVHLTVYFARLMTHHFNLVAHSKLEWCDQKELLKLNWANADLPIAKYISNMDLKKVQI